MAPTPIAGAMPTPAEDDDRLHRSFINPARPKGVYIAHFPAIVASWMADPTQTLSTPLMGD